MALISLIAAGRLRVVDSVQQITGVADEAIVIGAPVRLATATGKITNSNGTSAAEARTLGIALNAAAAGEAVTVLMEGILDGFALAGAYDSDVFVSDTDGRLGDAAGTVSKVVGRVVPGWATTLGTAADKLLLLDMPNLIGASQAVEVTFGQAASPADETIFVANRAYQVTAIREVHSTAGTDAGAVNLQITKDTGTQAPGAGVDLLTNNANAGFNMKGTANTVQAGTLTATGADLLLAAGDRLSADYAGVLTALAGVNVTVTLLPV